MIHDNSKCVFYLVRVDQDKNPEPKLQHQVKRGQNETNLSLSFTNVFVRVRLSKHQKEFISFFYLSEDKEKERDIRKFIVCIFINSPSGHFSFFPSVVICVGARCCKTFLSDLFSRAGEGSRDILLLVFIYFITLFVQPQLFSIFRHHLQFWVISWNILSCFYQTPVYKTLSKMSYRTLFMWNSRFWVMSKCVFNCQTKSLASNLQVKHGTPKYLTHINLKL